MRTQRRTTRVSSVFRYSPLVAALACAFAPAESAAATITVTNNSDGGAGSLRQAIYDANSNCYSDLAPTIDFSGPFVIQPSTPLPPFSCGNQGGAYTPTVDATVAPYAANTDPNNFNGNFSVLLDGSVLLAYGGGDGLTFSTYYGGVLTVKGLELAHFNNALVGNLIVKGNYIHHSAGSGVLVSGANGSGSQVGSSTLADRNYFYANYNGAFFQNVSNITVQNNLFVNNSFGLSASTVTNLNVDTGNRFAYNNYGISGAFVTGAMITGNYLGTLDGTSASGNTTYGIDWDESSGNIFTNVIVGNFQAGIHFLGDGGTTFYNNKVGVDASGNSPIGNGWGVVLDFSYGAQVTNNTISGNLYGGVVATYDNGSTIADNYIGTTTGGMAAAGNNGCGVCLNSSSNSHLLDNLISGNSGAGVEAFDSDTLEIKDNYIGTNNSGNSPIPNGQEGIVTTCGFNIKLQDNLVAGNAGSGIVLAGTNGPGAPPPPMLANPDGGLKRGKSGPSPNILYNRVGVGNSRAVLPNGGHGIHVINGGCGLGADASGNSFLQNEVANNQGMGITLWSGVGNTLSQTTVYDNVVKNIDINNNYGGPLPNDDGSVPPDSDSGPNNQQNYPEITTVFQATDTTVLFQLYSTPSRTFHVEIFDNLPSMPAHPAGKKYRADTFVNTDANGFASGSYTIGGITNFITLTATDTVTGDTSEYSPVGSFTPTPAVGMSATALDFGTVTVGQTSAPQSVTLTSTGTAPYHINTFDSQGTCYGGPICVGGDFTCTTTCSTVTNYSPGQTCSIQANFHPTVAGSTSSSIFICDNAGVRSITLLGNGLSASSSLALAPSQYDFGNVLVGQVSPGQDFTFSNGGATTASLGVISTTGDFGLVGTTCSGQLAPGASCKATVAFAPTLPGLRTGSVSMAPPVALARDHKVAVATVSASLKGTGTQSAQLDLPSSVGFGNMTLGTSPGSISVNVKNSGNAVVTFSSITVSGQFTLTNGCGLNLAPGQSCTLTLGFNPATLGDFTGTLTIVSNAPGGSRNIPVSAHVVAQSIPLIHVSPGFVGFGDRMIGTQSASSRIQIRNDGGAPAAVDLTTLSNDFIIVGNSCGLTLEPAGTCFADIVFQPAGFGGLSGQFRVNSLSTGDGQVTDLVGTGCRPYIPGTSRNHQQSNCKP